MGSRTKLQQTADRRSRERRRAIGVELRTAREDQGIAQRRLAEEAGIDPAHLARIEAGTVRASLEALERVAAGLGGDLGVRYFPNAGSRLRDGVQAAIVEALVARRHAVWASFAEVPVHRPARGVIDVVLARRDQPLVIAVEVHSQVRRLEQLLRWTSLKRESLPSADLWQHVAAGTSPTISSSLILRSTAATRSVARDHAATLRSAFPAASAEALSALLHGAPWPGPALIWADVAGGRATLRPHPPRGVDVGRVRRDGGP